MWIALECKSFILLVTEIDSISNSFDFKNFIVRCLNSDKCYGYQYNDKGTTNCILIQNRCGDPDGQIIEQDKNRIIYKKGLLLKIDCSRVNL